MPTKKKTETPKHTQVSLRGETYAKIKLAAEKRKQSVSSLVDELCAEFFDKRKRSS